MHAIAIASDNACKISAVLSADAVHTLHKPLSLRHLRAGNVAENWVGDLQHHACAFMLMLQHSDASASLRGLEKLPGKFMFTETPASAMRYQLG